MPVAVTLVGKIPGAGTSSGSGPHRLPLMGVGGRTSTGGTPGLMGQVSYIAFEIPDAAEATLRVHYIRFEVPSS